MHGLFVEELWGSRHLDLYVFLASSLHNRTEKVGANATLTAHTISTIKLGHDRGSYSETRFS